MELNKIYYIDCLVGSGITGKVAEKFNHNWIEFDTDKEYRGNFI